MCDHQTFRVVFTRRAVQEHARALAQPRAEQLRVLQRQFHCVQDGCLDVRQPPNVLPPIQKKPQPFINSALCKIS